MYFELKASTDAAQCAVFDPAALQEFLTISWDEILDSTGLDNGVLGRAEAAGKLMTFSPASDGTYVFRFYVDEAAPAELLAQPVTSILGALLRVPSGNLCAAGYEYLPQKEMKLKSISDYQVGELGQTHDIPPGNYNVEAYSLFSSAPAPMNRSSWWLMSSGCLSLPRPTP